MKNYGSFSIWNMSVTDENIVRNQILSICIDPVRNWCREYTANSCKRYQTDVWGVRILVLTQRTETKYCEHSHRCFILFREYHILGLWLQFIIDTFRTIDNCSGYVQYYCTLKVPRFALYSLICYWHVSDRNFLGNVLTEMGNSGFFHANPLELKRI